MLRLLWLILAGSIWAVGFVARADDAPPHRANFTTGAAQAVKFGTHEVVLKGNGAVVNPFDTEASVLFTPPSGASHAVPVKAFYDGGNTWRARVYVTEPGKWSWLSRSPADPSLDGRSADFTAVESDLPGLLKLHPANPRAWITASGKPFIGVSDTAWLLFGRDNLFWRKYVEDDAARGVNILGPVGSLESWGTGDVAHSGNNIPWLEANGVNYNRFDLAKFQNAEARIIWIFDHYPNLFIQSMLLPMQLQSTWTRSLTQAVRNKTLDYLIARWSAFPSLFWLISEDQDTKQAATIEFNREVGHYLAVHEPWKHLKSTEPNRRQGFPFTSAEDLEWVDYLCVQDYQGPGAEHIKKYHLSDVPRHVQFGEDNYEQDYGQAPSHWADPAYYVRWSMWSWILSGGSANYGGRYGVLHPYTQTGRKDLAWVGPAGTSYAGHALHGLDCTAPIIRYFEKRKIDLAFFKPDDDLITGFGRRPGLTWRPKLMRRDRDEFLIYHPNARSEEDAAKVDPSAPARLRIDLTNAPGNFQVEWYRASDGVAQNAEPVAGGAPQELRAPWKGHDVVLRLLKNGI